MKEYGGDRQVLIRKLAHLILHRQSVEKSLEDVVGPTLFRYEEIFHFVGLLLFCTRLVIDYAQGAQTRGRAGYV